MTTPPRLLELGFPGPLRDRLVAAVLDGTKTSTTGLVEDYAHEGEPLPCAGDRYTVVDSHNRPVAVVEVAEVRTLRLADVDWPHARDEGEGFTSVAEWRTDHESFWHSDAMREAMDDPAFTVTDDTLVVAERFRLIEVF